MNKLFVPLFLLLMIFMQSPLQAQKPYWQWTKSGGGSLNENGNRCVMDSRHNVYVTGRFSGTATFGTTVLMSKGNSDIFLAKYDSSGSLIWIKSTGGTGIDFGCGITLDKSQEHLYVSGAYTGTVMFDTTSVTSHGGQDVFIARYDTSGTLQWVKHGGTANVTSESYAVALDPSDQYVYATGFVGTNGKFDTITLTTSYIDIFLVKYDAATGNLIWAKNAGGISDDYGYDLTVDPSNNIYVTGYCKVAAKFGPFTISSTSADHSVFLAKYDTSGNVKWVKQAEGMGSTRNNDGNGVVVDKTSGNVFIFGTLSGTAYFDTIACPSKGQSDLFIARYDSTGILNWVRPIGSTGPEFGGHIDIDDFSNVYSPVLILTIVLLLIPRCFQKG